MSQNHLVEGVEGLIKSGLGLRKKFPLHNEVASVLWSDI